MSDIRGRFVWYEHLTRDVEAAIAFYTAVIGWNTQTWSGMGEPYHMFANGETAFAGVMKMPPAAEQPPNWLAYIGTPDVRETTALAESLGATIRVRLMEIPTVGTISVIQDPQGAMFAAYTPANLPPGSVGPTKAGEIGWHELATTDIDTAFAFYATLFGWVKKEAHDMGHMGTYQEYGLPDVALGGIYTKHAQMPGPPSWLLYVRVADLEAAVSRVQANGGSMLQKPIEISGGDRVAVFTDPQGAPFALHWEKA
jgi:hypothetical protein